MHSPVSHFYQVGGRILCNATSPTVLPRVLLVLLPLHRVPLGDVSQRDRLVAILQTQVINGSIQLDRHRTDGAIPDIAWFVFCTEKEVKVLRRGETACYNWEKKKQPILSHLELTG